MWGLGWYYRWRERQREREREEERVLEEWREREEMWAAAARIAARAPQGKTLIKPIVAPAAETPQEDRTLETALVVGAVLSELASSSPESDYGAGDTGDSSGSGWSGSGSSDSGSSDSGSFDGGSFGGGGDSGSW